jgi:hypothetical protein
MILAGRSGRLKNRSDRPCSNDVLYNDRSRTPRPGPSQRARERASWSIAARIDSRYRKATGEGRSRLVAEALNSSAGAHPVRRILDERSAV